MRGIVKSSFLFLSFIALNINNAYAEAWPNKKGTFENTFSTYYSAPVPSYIQTTLVDNATFQDAQLRIKKRFQRLSTTGEVSYGYDDKTTFFAKLDAGYINETFKTSIKRNGGEQISELNLDYFVLDPTVSILRQVYKTDLSVVSVQTKLYPGSYVISNDDVFYNEKLFAYELEFLFGQAFRAHLGDISKLFGAKRKDRWHYHEWKATAKHYPRLGQVQYDLDAEVGFRPTNRILAIFGIKATFNGGNFQRRPFRGEDLDRFVAQTPLNAGQMIEFRNILESQAKERSRFNNYQFSYKISQKVTRDAELSLQGVSNIILGKPFKNNIVVVAYEFKL